MGACHCGCTGWLDQLSHWWRSLVMDAFTFADEAWHIERETVAIGYAEEEAEFQLDHPRPTLKHMMTTMQGSRENPLED